MSHCDLSLLNNVLWNSAWMKRLCADLLFCSLLVSGLRLCWCIAKSFARCRSMYLFCSWLLALRATVDGLWHDGCFSVLPMVHNVVTRQTITHVLLLVNLQNPSEFPLRIQCVISYLHLFNSVCYNCPLYFIINKI